MLNDPRTSRDVPWQDAALAHGHRWPDGGRTSRPDPPPQQGSSFLALLEEVELNTTSDGERYALVQLRAAAQRPVLVLVREVQFGDLDLLCLLVGATVTIARRGGLVGLLPLAQQSRQAREHALRQLLQGHGHEERKEREALAERVLALLDPPG